ncbi:MAG: histidine phosphatase family protein [Candidatus Bostrichicola ureolyticus]|nr:MAG: histidine phosphatase family protein [Candidatus Bostrichicola ureolyticus]
MKKLILVRHSNAIVENKLKDKDRHLTILGIEIAYKVAFFLKKKLTINKKWLSISSPAIRALHTAVIFSYVFNTLSSLKIEECLYTFSVIELQKFIKSSIDSSFDNIILFGHNSGITELVNLLGNNIFINPSGLAILKFNTLDNLNDGVVEYIIDPNQIN